MWYCGSLWVMPVYECGCWKQAGRRFSQLAAWSEYRYEERFSGTQTETDGSVLRHSGAEWLFSTFAMLQIPPLPLHHTRAFRFTRHEMSCVFSPKFRCKQTQASLLHLISIAAALTSRIKIKNVIVKLRLHHSLQPRIFFLPGVGRSSPDFHSIPCLIPNDSRFIVAPSYDL